MSQESFDKFIEDLKIPTKELKVSSKLSFVFFEIGGEPFYIKIFKS